MKDGNRATFCAGDAFHIPPRHDAYVDGDEEVRKVRGLQHGVQLEACADADPDNSSSFYLCLTQVEMIEVDHKSPW